MLGVFHFLIYNSKTNLKHNYNTNPNHKPNCNPNPNSKHGISLKLPRIFKYLTTAIFDSLFLRLLSTQS